MDLISVIMPTFNGSAFLERALTSVLEQDDPMLEIHVLDDGSSDNTLAIAQAFQSKLPLIIHPPSTLGNWAANSNRALPHLSGEYVTFLHQDDYWLPNKLATLRSASEQGEDYSVLLHPSLYVDAQGRELGIISCPFTPDTPIKTDEVLRKLLVQNFIMMPAPLIRTSALRACGGFDESLWYTADWKLWLGLASHGDWYYIDKPLAAFRLHANAQTVTSSHNADDFRQQHLDVLRAFPVSSSPEDQATAKLAVASAEINVALASLFHRGSCEWRRLWSALRALKLRHVPRLLAYSRLYERVRARLLTRLRQRRALQANSGAV